MGIDGGWRGRDEEGGSGEVGLRQTVESFARLLACALEAKVIMPFPFLPPVCVLHPCRFKNSPLRHNPSLFATLDSVQFPDPHFKAKHKKRRMVQPALVAAMCASLKPEGGEILIQSDVLEVAESMREAFAEDELVTDVCPPGEWMEENPLMVPTEREIDVGKRGSGLSDCLS